MSENKYLATLKNGKEIIIKDFDGNPISLWIWAKNRFDSKVLVFNDVAINLEDICSIIRFEGYNE